MVQFGKLATTASLSPPIHFQEIQSFLAGIKPLRQEIVSGKPSSGDAPGRAYDGTLENVFPAMSTSARTKCFQSLRLRSKSPWGGARWNASTSDPYRVQLTCP
mmetsp:Transcript_26444/g.57006  ORF Transcript_26444/g.57006 Transcript_26444/m.57006 type:complete len:103 (+) Transcript_26444:684-992(+)